MAENTGIEWCDSTFNPWTGCTKVSPACDLCYAEKWSKRAGEKVGKWGPGMPRVRTTPANWRLPLRWHATPFWQCTCCGWRGVEADTTIRDDGFGAWVSCPTCHAGAFAAARRRVFCASLADVFDNEVDPEWRRDLLNLILSTPNLDWLLLTKRIGNAARMIEATLPDSMKALPEGHPLAWPWPHVWIGATICNQAEADRDIPKLLAMPAAVRFLSMEPLLGPVDLRSIPISGHGHHEFDPIVTANVLRRAEQYPPLPQIDWVIVGGESGHDARTMHPEWARSLRDQCEAAGVPFLFKQWGEWAPRGPAAWGYPLLEGVPRIRLTDTSENGSDLSAGGSHHVWMQRAGKKVAGRLLDGRTWDERPQ